MRGLTWKLAILAGVVWGSEVRIAEAAPPPKKNKYKEAALDIAIGSIRGVEMASQVAEQEAAARENWKKVTRTDKPPFVETDSLLVLGKVPDRALKDIAALLEKQYALARTALDMEKEDPWPGKLTIYLFPDRRQFASFVRTVEKRRPDKDDTGSNLIKGDFPHVAAGPPAEEGESNVPFQAAEQLGAALIARKIGPGVPEWVVAGFGRATFFRAGPPRDMSAERKRVAKLLAYNKATAMNVYDGQVKAEEAPFLRGSLVDYLAYGPGRSRFAKFLEGYKPEEGVLAKTTADALKAVRIDPNVLNARWRAWVRRVR
jgi:hypothetical protein